MAQPNATAYELKNTYQTDILESTNTTDRYENNRMGWGDAIVSQFLAKPPADEAPVELGGHRQAVEPQKLGPFGVLAKFVTFIGPGIILAIPLIDPDNYQDNISSGQEFAYKQLCMVWVAVAVATYFQVSMFIKTVV